jgi:signal transduction histidine kinase
VITMAPDLHVSALHAAKTQRVAAHMAQVLEDLLDFSSFEAGKLRLVLGEVDIVQVVNDAVSIEAEVAKANRLELTCRTQLSSATMTGDGRRLTRLLMNLISNALKYTAAGGHVTVAVSASSADCEIAVTDSGQGIPTDQLETIFERFQQVGTQQRRASGVGLGLYIARLIVEAHGGRIWAESDGKSGSTFRVQLPMVARSERA